MTGKERIRATLAGELPDADNRANPNSVSIVLRIDAGFSTGPNLAWLIEMGYTLIKYACHKNDEKRTTIIKPFLPLCPRLN